MNRWLSHVSEGVTLDRIMSGCNGTKVGVESHPTKVWCRRWFTLIPAFTRWAIAAIRSSPSGLCLDHGLSGSHSESEGSLCEVATSQSTCLCSSGYRTLRLPHISEEMRHLCVLLGEEVVRWPGVNVRPMFGMRAFYRANNVFAMLPEKRALENPHAISYKVATGTKKKEGKKWKFFELTTAKELGTALAVLDEAYRKVGRPHRKNRTARAR